MLATAGALLALVAGVHLFVSSFETRPADDALAIAAPTFGDLSDHESPAAPLGPLAEEAPEATRVSVAPHPVERVDAAHSGSIFLEGTVTDSAGSPIEKARIATRPHPEANPMVTRTNAAGHYRIGPLQAGRHWVFASVEDAHRALADLRLSEQQPLVRQDFRLDPVQRIEVRVVTPQGVPLAKKLEGAPLDDRLRSVGVWATRVEPGSAIPTDPGASLPRSVGSFENRFRSARGRSDPMIHGSVLVDQGVTTGWISLVVGSQVLRKQPFDRFTEELVFTVKVGEVFDQACAVQGVLVAAETGEPLAGEVAFGHLGARQSKGQKVSRSGCFALRGASPTERWLVARAPGRGAVRIPLRLVPGGGFDCGRIALAEAVELRGQLVSSVRTRLGGPLHLEVVDPATGETDSRAWTDNSWRCKPDGSFAITGVAPGVYLISPPRISDRSGEEGGYLWALPVRVDATGGSVSGIRIPLQTTTRVDLVGPPLVGQQSLRVEVSEPSGRSLSSGVITRQKRNRQHQVWLVPGEYELRITREKGVTERRPLYVGSSRLPITVNL